MKTGQIIAQLRTQAGLTQQQLAEKLYVSRDLVSKWETCRRLPNYDTVQRLAEIFGVGPEVLIKRNELLLRDLADYIPQGMTAEQLRARLPHFLDSLKERDRSVFIRRYYLLEEPAETAAAYHYSTAYVRTILMRTRKRLKKHLKEAML